MDGEGGCGACGPSHHPDASMTHKQTTEQFLSVEVHQKAAAESQQCTCSVQLNCCTRCTLSGTTHAYGAYAPAVRAAAVAASEARCKHTAHVEAHCDGEKQVTSTVSGRHGWQHPPHCHPKAAPNTLKPAKGQRG